MKPIVLTLALAVPLLGGCDLISQRLGLEDPQQKEAKADAEGRAVGSACRQSGRAIEDCYSLYRWLPKASIFAGWREMNDYMQANNLGVVEPKLPPAPGPDEKKKKPRPISEAESDKKPDGDKGGEKAGAKTEDAAGSKTDGNAEKPTDAATAKTADAKK